MPWHVTMALGSSESRDPVSITLPTTERPPWMRRILCDHFDVQIQTGIRQRRSLDDLRINTAEMTVASKTR